MVHSPLHKFIVFSEFDDTGAFVTSFAQCSNCDVLHKITEVGRSEILKKEHLPSLLTTEEIKGQLPEKLVTSLLSYDLELHRWQEIKWIMENEGWGKAVILTKEETDGITTGKYIQFIGTNMWKFGSFTREEQIAQP